MKSSNYLLLLLLLAGPVFAKASSNGDEPTVCPKTRMTIQQANTALENDTVTSVPAAATRATPVRTTTRSAAPRTVSPRWHTMLPGMFR